MNQQPTPGALRAAERVSSYFFNTKYTFDEELAAIIDSEMPTQVWQPIETSPRDGTAFLAFVPHSQSGFCFAALWNIDSELVCMMSNMCYTGKATHWMPMPSHPSAAQPKPPSGPAWRYFRNPIATVRISESLAETQIKTTRGWGNGKPYYPASDYIAARWCEITAEEAGETTNPEKP